MAELSALPMGQKVALVTGGNRGIGRETAWQLARSGVHVIVGARDAEKANAIAASFQDQGYSAAGMALDVSVSQSREAAAATIDAHYGKLDILVNNAGAWLESEDASHPVANNASTISEQTLRAVFDVNFFGTVALTQTLLPLIRRSPAGRIVNVSSVLGSLTLHSDYGSVVGASKAFGYDASKTALNAFTVHLAHELRHSPIKVNSIHPGWVRSEMGGARADMSLEEGARLSVRFATLAEDGPSGEFHFDTGLPW